MTSRTASGEALPPAFDPFDARPDRDLTEGYAAVRRHAPVWEIEPGIFLLSRYRDVRNVLLDRTDFSNHGNFFLGPADGSAEPPNITHLDPPEHTQLRAVLLEGFSAGPVRAAEPWVQSRAEQLAEDLAGAGVVDLCSQFALPLTTSVIARLVGLPPVDADRVVGWSQEIVQLRPAAVADIPAFTSLFGYLQALLEDRRRSSGLPDDMITRLMRRPGRPADPADDDREIVTHVYQLMAAGYPTTAYTIGMGLHALLAEPALWAGVVADRSLVAVVREESLRYGSAIRQVFRTALREREIDGVTVPAGSRVVLALESANRDEGVFFDPGRFRMDRGEIGRQHLAFGSGIHLCLGATLARTEIDAAIGVLAERLAQMALAGAARPAHHHVLVAGDPLQGPQRLLGGAGDGAAEGVGVGFDEGSTSQPGSKSRQYIRRPVSLRHSVRRIRFGPPLLPLRLH